MSSFATAAVSGLRCADELESLKAIYVDELSVDTDQHSNAVTVTYRPQSNVSLRVHIPPSYPTSLPLFEIDDGTSVLDEGDYSALLAEFSQTAEVQEGQDVLFPLIESFRARWTERSSAAAAAASNEDLEDNFEELHTVEEGQFGIASYDDDEGAAYVPYEKRGSASNIDPPSTHLRISTGEKVEDRKSIFQAHVAQVHSKEDVAEMTRILLSDRRIARATHNIMACRYRDAKTGALRQDNDDDGETAAGSRLAHLLGVIDATDVCVIVSRWYGGIQLGPDRFRRINEVARQQLELEGFIPLKGSASTAAAAKGKKSKK